MDINTARANPQTQSTTTTVVVIVVVAGVYLSNDVCYLHLHLILLLSFTTS